MSRTRALAIVAAGIIGYVLFAWLFPRFSMGAQWHIALGKEESIARARAVAAGHGLDVRGWPTDAGAQVDRQLDEAQIYVGFRNPRVDEEGVGIRLDASGRPTAVVHQREQGTGDDVTVDAARPIAERAFRAFVPDAGAYHSVAQEDLGGGGVRFRWERAATNPDLVHQASAIVAGSTVLDLRYDTERSAEGRRRNRRSALNILDSISDITLIFSGLFGLVLYIIARGRGLVPQRLGLTVAGTAWLLLLVEMFGELDQRVMGIFEGNAQGRWTLIVASAIIAIPAGLATVGAYGSMRRRFPHQLVSLEELVLRGRLTSRNVGVALLTGIAAGGWIAVVPHLIRATGVFGSYGLDDAFDEPLFRTGLVPMKLYGGIATVLLAFALLSSFAQDKLRGRIGAAIGFLLAFAVMVDDSVESMAAALIAGLIVTLIYDQLFRRGDFLTLVAAAASAAWAISAASRLVQPAQSIRSDGGTAVILGIVIAAAALAIALWGSVKPYTPWQPRPARAERERIQNEFDVARVAQERMLPKTPPELPGTSIASFCRPAKQVGGDLYDFVTMSDGTVGITVADVSGKGVSAALVMTITKGLLLAASDGRSEPLQILADVNAGIHSLGHRSVFVTMLFGVFDPARRTFEFVRAGHTPLLWRKATGQVEMLSPKGIGVGMTSPRMFSRLCERTTITVGADDFLFLYSDGVNEAMNERSEEFGDDRLIATVRDRITPTMTAEEARVAIVEAVDDFRGKAPAHDDMTLVVVKC